MAQDSTNQDSASSDKKPRRLRVGQPAATTVRQRAEKAQTESEKTPKPRRFKPASEKASKPFKKVGRPLRRIGRFLIPAYFRNSWRELRLVTWPNARQTRRLTIAVIIFAIIFGIVVAVLDYFLGKLFKEILVS